MVLLNAVGLHEGTVFASGFFQNRSPNSEYFESDEYLDDIVSICGPVKALYKGYTQFGEDKNFSFIRCMEPLTGGDADMIPGGNQWLLILVRRKFQKFSKEVSKKLDFGHLRVKGENDDDDDPRAEKIFRRWCHFARFFPCRGEGCLAKCTA